jgi:hypothetical protein
MSAAYLFAKKAIPKFVFASGLKNPIDIIPGTSKVGRALFLINALSSSILPSLICALSDTAYIIYISSNSSTLWFPIASPTPIIKSGYSTTPPRTKSPANAGAGINQKSVNA